ncbi:ExeA family protein [Candidatus Omnitrophota bacterium]
MYKRFYNLKEKPFNMNPDSKFFFPSEIHSEALNNILYAINEKKGFTVITGEIGSGKTTVCRNLLNKLEKGTKLALITNTHLTPKQLICAILEELEITFNYSWAKVKLISCLNQYLIEQLSLNFNVILVIDEAQNLNLKTLEEVRMLSNLETEREKLIQIILLGQPEFKDKLNSPVLEQLKQRVVVYYHLSPLSFPQTKEYINYRLQVAGLNGNVPMFFDGALYQIYYYSRGIPRLINSICDRALLTGYIKETWQITTDIINEVASELHLKKESTYQTIMEVN